MISFRSFDIATPTGRRLGAAGLTVAAALAMPTTAMAQDRGEPGFYGVARAGVQLDSDIKFPKQPTPPAAKPGTPAARPAAPTIPPGFNRNIDNDAGFAGELGAGYDFRGFRLEGTVGYNTAPTNGTRLGNANYFADGRMKSLDIGVSAYVDLNRDGRIHPFAGGGIGASRVSLDESRYARPSAPQTGSRLAGTLVKDRDWGFRWHVDAGVGYDLKPGTTVELSGRYSQTSALDFKGQSVTISGTGSAATVTTTTNTFKPRTSATSLMVGLRQRF